MIRNLSVSFVEFYESITGEIQQQWNISPINT